MVLRASVSGGEPLISPARARRVPLQRAQGHLRWTLPRFQCAESVDILSGLVALAHWMLFLARPIVADTPCLGRSRSSVCPRYA